MKKLLLMLTLLLVVLTALAQNDCCQEEMRFRSMTQLGLLKENAGNFLSAIEVMKHNGWATDLDLKLKKFLDELTVLQRQASREVVYRIRNQKDDYWSNDQYQEKFLKVNEDFSVLMNTFIIELNRFSLNLNVTKFSENLYFLEIENNILRRNIEIHNLKAPRKWRID